MDAQDLQTFEDLERNGDKHVSVFGVLDVDDFVGFEVDGCGRAGTPSSLELLFVLVQEISQPPSARSIPRPA